MISYGLTINGDAYGFQIGGVIALDGTEEFDSGLIQVKHITKSTPFTEADDVVLTVGTKTFYLMIQADRVTKINETKYNHYITLTEETAKLVKRYSVDRFFTTNNGSLFTHYEIADRVRLTSNLGKTPNYTIATATQTALGTNSPQKKFEGMNEFQIHTDLMRGIKAVPRLINGVLNHSYYNEMNNPITLSSLKGWQKDNDFNNYATTIVSRAKNITYDYDLTTGATWFPSKDEKATPRSSSGDYSDETAEYQLPLDIRRVLKVYIIDYELSGGTFIDMDISDYVFSKEAWDGLELGSRLLSTLMTQIAQRNTLYYTIGDNTIVNMANEYKDSIGGTDYPIESLIKSWLTNNGYLITDFKAVAFSEIAIRVQYQPYVEANISAEKWDTSVTKTSEILNNQKDTILDIGRYGGVMNTIANRLSNGDWQIVVKHADETELFELYDYTTDGYKVIKAKYELYPNHIVGTYQLSLRWATLNGYQSVYKNTDPYSIGRDNVNANFRYTEYLELSKFARTGGSLTTQGKKTLMNIFDYIPADDLPVNTGIFDSSEVSDTIALGIMSTGANGMRFIGRFQEPKNAGYELVSDSIGKGSNAIPYTDKSGYMLDFDISYVNTYTVTSGENEYPKLSSPLKTSLITLPNLTVYKNPNEVFGLNYELIPCTDDSETFIVYDTFSRNNNLVNDGIINYYIFFSLSTTTYDIFDTAPKDIQATFTIGNATVSKGATPYFDISGISTSKNVTWAVGTSDSLLFAVNYNGTTIERVYFNNIIDRSTTEDM